MDISQSLDRPDIISSYEVIDHRTWYNGHYIRITVHLNDKSVLHVREYVSATERDYSYHWQTADNVVICRWDNSRHHRDVPTFPHHKHRDGKILASTEITLDDVLSVIAGQLLHEKD